MGLWLVAQVNWSDGKQSTAAEANSCGLFDRGEVDEMLHQVKVASRGLL